MKAFVKIGIVAALLVSSTLVSKAQSSSPAASSKQEFRLSVGPEFAVPVGNLSNAYNWNLGGMSANDYSRIETGWAQGCMAWRGAEWQHVHGNQGAYSLDIGVDLLSNNAVNFISALITMAVVYGYFTQPRLDPAL